jgi:hypothetical protein
VCAHVMLLAPRALCLAAAPCALSARWCVPQAKLARAAEERDFLKHLNDNLLSNQRELQEQIRAAEAASRDSTDGREAHIKARAVVVACTQQSELCFPC